MRQAIMYFAGMMVLILSFDIFTFWWFNDHLSQFQVLKAKPFDVSLMMVFAIVAIVAKEGK